jgi:hypothetical protein
MGESDFENSNMAYRLLSEQGQLLDAAIDIEGEEIVLHSRGTANAKPINPDYSKTLNLIFQRLVAHKATIEGAWVDSSRVQHLPISDRMILDNTDSAASPDDLLKRASARMAQVGRSATSEGRGGNQTKKIRIRVSLPNRVDDLKKIIGAQSVEVTRRTGRLPASELNKVSAENIWNSIQKLLGGYKGHGFDDSLDYDVVTDTGTRLPPKAVFGIAATEALGFKVEPRHFSAGINTPCFRILENAGFPVVPKEGTSPPPKGSRHDEVALDPVSDSEFREGTPRLRQHLRKERAQGLRQAKLAHFRRQQDGRLFCERCGFDPREKYASPDADAAIEVHHASVQIQSMSDGHITTLADLTCLCANCHRVVHSELRRSSASKTE